MDANTEWASWLVTRRPAIDQALARRRGALPGAASAESEALRRFRSFAAAALRRGEASPPALDGLRVDGARAAQLVDAWCGAAVELAAPRGRELRTRLEPLAAHFSSALLTLGLAHAARRPARTGRRAVPAAIDRIADAFLAVELDGGTVVDANPAATSLLATPRERLLGATAAGFVPPEEHASWQSELDALVESAAPRRFAVTWRDARGHRHRLDVAATRHGRRDGTLALLLARPRHAP